MKAAYIEQPGLAQQIRYGDLAMPIVGERDVLVKVLAVTVNAVDTYIRSGQYQIQLPSPFIIGRDLTGVVVEVGPAVTRFQPGEHVWANNQGYDGRQGTFAECCSIDEQLLYHLPAGVDPYEAVTVLHSGLTAVSGLSRVGVQPGETIFVNGGDGSIGSAVLMIAKALGAKVIVTSGDEQKAHWCRELGADHIINYKLQDIHQVLKELVPEGLNIYWDATKRFSARKALEVTAKRGRIVVMAGLNHETVLPVGTFYSRGYTMYGFTVTDASTAELRRYAKQINGWLATGVLHGRIAERLPLEQAAWAHQIYETQNLFGKLVLSPEWKM
ncbi:NADPH:quinone reductase [Ktedonosporobacter rubrisoli]|uniref:NADPH:quinone reductase n=2 Tax=Ktedonosporobacter rubrisoli TaxID=2509675 RepID=A0A4P6K507_KTERU|nr:NADPH:quinone reductase [Ktedonosporobacter rubrisoli]